MWTALDIGAWKAGRKADLEAAKEAAAGIIREVAEKGDAALLGYARTFDGVEMESVVVTDDEREEAYDEVEARVVEALIEAEARITTFHELQRKDDLWLREVEPGITLGMKTTPLSRVGCYIPGGRASYPSTALMTVVPARVAGVSGICCCTPPPASSLTIVALDIAGAGEIYRVGGAQAITAMARGTESIAPVEKIVGPGNVYVTAAKMMLREDAEIDFPAGPSEIAIIADSGAKPSFIAADILAQAEHDPQAGCALITTDSALAEEVGREIARQAASAPRREIIEQALARSGFLIAADLEEAAALSDDIAPEHLSLQVTDPLGLLGKIRNAGSIFIGPWTPVACGDYASGTNHVLPTAGFARRYSGLTVATFQKTSTVQMLSEEGLEALAGAVETLAEAEGLAAHAESVRIRRRMG